MLGQAEDYPHAVKYSLLWALWGFTLDILTSVGCEQLFWPTCTESNAMLVNTATGRYLPEAAIALNGLAFVSLWGPMALLLGLAFRKKVLASLPFWYLGFEFASVGCSNLMLMGRIFMHEVFHI